MYSGWFSGKVYCEACCGGMKKWDAMFFVSIPTISTIVLNDSSINSMPNFPAT